MQRRLVALFAFVLFAFVVAAAGQSTFRAGAARVDITPGAGEALPMAGYAGRTQGHQGIHDRIYVRALAVDEGAQAALLLAFEVIFVPNDVWEELSHRLSRETGVPVENILLSAVHTHGAPSVGTTRPGGQPGPVDPMTGAYTERMEEAAVQAAKQARAALQPARMGVGSGVAYLNMNRRELRADGLWWLGHNPGGVSDKTVAVVKFEGLSGKPIALYINYAVHGTIMGQENLQITGDLPGATSRWVEGHLRQDVVALWTSGAAGDQDPVSFSRGADQNIGMVDAFGQVLGEEVIRVARRIQTHAARRVFGAQRVVTCPGQKLAPGPRPRRNYEFSDGDPVNIRLSLLMLDQVAFAGVSGEVLTMIGTRLKKESPFSQTLMVTHTNGSSGYIPDDAAYDQVSYEITTTRLKRGCAENAIVAGFLEMMQQTAAVAR